MKNHYRQIALVRLCRLLGVTRQAYYQHFKSGQNKRVTNHIVLKQILSIRKWHPRMGGRKIYKMIKPFLQHHTIKMGRDALFNLMEDNQLQVIRKKRKNVTTNSYHRFHKYPNLINGYTPQRINEIWVSDITYWKIDEGYVYISLITDAYSRKVVGYHVAKNLGTAETLQALTMALKKIENKPSRLIHHSDRGIQYCSTEYVKLLQDNNIQISMTANGDPYENALAERMNGILKGEYLYEYAVSNLTQARKIMDLTVKLYNEERPHMSWDYKTPESVHALILKC